MYWLSGYRHLIHLVRLAHLGEVCYRKNIHMTKMIGFSSEVRERAIRLVFRGKLWRLGRPDYFPFLRASYYPEIRRR